MKLLPLLNYLPYSTETHKEYYRKMPKIMAKYESALEDMGAIVEIDPQEEDINIFDHFDENEKAAQRIADKYNSGNMWAWFCAKVTVKYKGLEATDYLGACSYENEKDFKKGGYYYDMVNTCVEEINRDIQDHNDEIQKNWNIRKAKNLVSLYGLAIVNLKKIQELA